jgi:hypothetical protein
VLARFEVVASGRTSVEALAKARRQFPSRPLTDIAALAVPKTLNVLYHFEEKRRRSALLDASTAEAERIQALLNEL